MREPTFLVSLIVMIDNLKKTGLITEIGLIGDVDSDLFILQKKCLGKRLKAGHEATIGVEFSVLDYTYKDIPIKIKIWALHTSERFKEVRKLYHKATKASMIVFNIAKPETFHAIKTWIEEVWHSIGTVPIALIGNNAHLRNNQEKKSFVSSKLGKKYAKKVSKKVGFKVPYFEIGEACENVNEILQFFIESMFEELKEI
jgi:GTPase SAR1 family protein